MYDLVDKKLQVYYIKCHKYVCLISLGLSMIFVILSISQTDSRSAYLSFFVVSLFISLIFLFTWLKNKKKYLNKLSFSNKFITIYNHKNKKIKNFKIDNLKSLEIKIAFDVYPRFEFISCLLLYIDFEPYEKMEYSSYWNENNIVIIQNPQLIDIVKSFLDNYK